MSKLTPKQENFCLAYLETGNASEAYRRAYDSKNMKPESVNRLAKAQLENVKIASRIENLRAPVREKVLLTLESHLTRLAELSKRAEEAEQFGPAIAAETNRGKAAGLYTDKVDVTSKGESVSAPTRIIIEAAAQPEE